MTTRKHTPFGRGTRIGPWACLLLCLLTLSGAGAARADVYVSPTGSDASPGTLAAPVQTLSHAQTLARGQGASGVRVYLRGGTYRLPATLALTSADSGETWTAYNGETPVVSGGQAVTGWTLHDSANNIWQASVPAGTDTRSLYVNGVRCYRAHALVTAAIGTLSQTATGYTVASNPAASWGNPTNVELVYPNHWTESRLPVASMTATSITMQEPGYWEAKNQTQVVPTEAGDAGCDAVGIPYTVENAYELLSVGTPGQFYLNKTSNILYYVPRNNEYLPTATVVMPLLQADVTVSGATGVTFSGLQFSDTTWLEPHTPNGFAELQTGVYFNYPSATQSALVPFGQFGLIPAAVQVSGGSGVNILNCVFQRLGSGGLSLQNGTASDVVKGNLFNDCSAFGVCIGNVLDWKTSTPVTGATVSDNTIHDIAVEFHGSPGVLAFTAQNCSVSHNLIYNTPYSGIAWGVGWINALANPSVSSGNVVASNLIYKTMQTRNDGGSIYVNGSNSGLSITGNVCHDQPSSNGPNVIYLDNGNGPNSLVQNNAVYNVPGGEWFDVDDYGGNFWQYNWTDGVSFTALPPYTNSDNPGTVAPSTMKQTLSSAVGAFPASITSRSGLEPGFGGASSAPPATLTTPYGLSVAKQGVHAVLRWGYAGSGVAYYEVYRNGVVIATTTKTAYIDPDTTAGQTYAYTVDAQDAQGRLSQPCAAASATF